MSYNTLKRFRGTRLRTLSPYELLSATDGKETVLIKGKGIMTKDVKYLYDERVFTKRVPVEADTHIHRHTLG